MNEPAIDEKPTDYQEPIVGGEPGPNDEGPGQGEPTVAGPEPPPSEVPAPGGVGPPPEARGREETPPAAPTPMTVSPPPPAPVLDLARHAAGTFDVRLLSGAPADAVKRFVLMRAGVGPTDPEVAGLPDVRLDFRPARDAMGVLLGPDVARVPDPFPPAGYAAPLASVADWLACVDASRIEPGA